MEPNTPTPWPPQGWPKPHPKHGYDHAGFSPILAPEAEALELTAGLEDAIRRAAGVLVNERHGLDAPQQSGLLAAIKTHGPTAYNATTVGRLPGASREMEIDPQRKLAAILGLDPDPDPWQRAIGRMRAATVDLYAVLTAEALDASDEMRKHWAEVLEDEIRSGRHADADAAIEALCKEQQATKDPVLAMVLNGRDFEKVQILMSDYERKDGKNPTAEDCKRLHGFPRGSRTHAAADALTAAHLAALELMAQESSDPKMIEELRAEYEKAKDPAQMIPDEVRAQMPEGLAEVLGRSMTQNGSVEVVKSTATTYAEGCADAVAQTHAAALSLVALRLAARGDITSTVLAQMNGVLARAAIQTLACFQSAENLLLDCHAQGPKAKADTPAKWYAALGLGNVVHRHIARAALRTQRARQVHNALALMAPAWTAHAEGRSMDAVNAALDALAIPAQQRAQWLPFALRLVEDPTAPFALRRTLLATADGNDHAEHALAHQDAVHAPSKDALVALLDGKPTYKPDFKKPE